MKYLLFLPEQPLPLKTASENISPPVLKNETKIDVRCLLASKREKQICTAIFFLVRGMIFFPFAILSL